MTSTGRSVLVSVFRVIEMNKQNFQLKNRNIDCAIGPRLMSTSLRIGYAECPLLSSSAGQIPEMSVRTPVELERCPSDPGRISPNVRSPGNIF